MSTTETATHTHVATDIIEHEPIVRVPATIATADETAASEAAAEPNKREQARNQRAQLLAQQQQLQRLLDEIEDEQDDDVAQLQQQVAQLQEEVAQWRTPENHHSVFAQIGLFALAASLLCWLLAPLIAGQSGYLDQALHTAAILLGYAAAALLLFVAAQNNKH